MYKKAIHHCSRAVVTLLEIAGYLAIFAGIGMGALLWRLSQGPLNIDFLASRLETSLAQEHPGFEFHVASTLLTWRDRYEPLEVEMDKVQVNRADKTPVLTIDKLGIRLSKHNLLLGRIVPRMIMIYSPVLRVVREEDGRILLSLGPSPAEPYGPPVPQPAEESQKTVSQTQLVQGFLKELQEKDGALGLLQGLHDIEAQDADITFDDKILKITWVSKNADVVISREKDSLSSTISMTVDMGQGRNAAVHDTVHYDWATGVSESTVSFAGIIPAALAQNSEGLKKLSGIDLPLKGTVDFVLDKDFNPGMVKFAIASDPGKLSIDGYYHEPIDIADLFLSGAVDVAQMQGKIDQFQISLGAQKPHEEKTAGKKQVPGGIRLQATAKMSKDADGKGIAEINAALLDMPVDDLKKYWPESLATDARAWVTTHLSKGIATKATLDLSLGIDPATRAVSLGKVGGVIDYTGITVNYFPPLPAATLATGTASYDDHSFNLDIASGKLEDMTVTKSVIHMTGLDKADDAHHAMIDVSADLNGPLKTALEVLDSEPLKYPDRLGIKISGLEGDDSVHVGMKFPLYNALKLDEIVIDTTAKIDHVKLEDVVGGMALTGGPMDLSVDSGALKVKGSGKLGTMPLTFDWSKNFSESAAVASHLSAKITLDAAGMKSFGMPASLNAAGTLPATVVYDENQDGSAKLNFQGDMTDASYSIPMVNVQKAVGDKGSVAFNLLLKNKSPDSISGLNLQTDKLTAQGDLSFAADGIGKAHMTQLILGGTNIALDAENMGSAGYQVKASGRQLDASSVFTDDTKPNSDADAAQKSVPFMLTANVDRIVTGDNKYLDKAKLVLQRNAWQRIDRLELDALTENKPITVRYLPLGSGHSLHVAASNAGAALNDLGLVKSVHGGGLSVDGKTPPGGGPRDLQGTAILSDFTMKDAPVLATLLNAMSLSGIQSLLTGNGITFKKARVNYTWTDRGQPAQPNNVRLITLSDGQTSGASLGLTFAGNIDNWKNVYDMNGTIIPVSDLNKLLSIIPIVGNVLTANGEGIIAATYTLKGPKDNPSVSVNPLSVLAPGILRKIFFEK